MVLFDCIFINNSGGKVLLDYLIESFNRNKTDLVILADSRLQGRIDYFKKENLVYIEPSIRKRHAFYRNNRGKITRAFCFGNIPPTVRLKGEVVTYFHNLLMVEQPADYPRSEKLKKILKGAFIRFYLRNTSYIYVQTDYNKNVFSRNMAFAEDRVKVVPFFDANRIKSIDCREDEFSFCFISNGNPHKNHNRLLDAWEALYNAGYTNLELNLTVTSNYKHLTDRIEGLVAQGLKIVNHGIVDPTAMLNRCKYFLYPSLIESFGLGLIEAAALGKVIVAADLPYVHEVVHTSETFDPASSESIVAAVKKALDGGQPSSMKIKDSIDVILKFLNN